jgi:hypothetical protein
MDLIEQKYLLYQLNAEIALLSICIIGFIISGVAVWHYVRKDDGLAIPNFIMMAASIIAIGCCSIELVKIQTFPELFLSENSKRIAEIRKNLEESRNERAID